MKSWASWLVPISYIVIGFLIQKGYYSPRSRTWADVDPQMLINTGIFFLLLTIYITFFHQKVYRYIKILARIYKFKARKYYFLSGISASIFFLFLSVDVFSLDPLNDLFLYIGGFGMVYGVISIYEKKKKEIS